MIFQGLLVFWNFSLPIKKYFMNSVLKFCLFVIVLASFALGCRSNKETKVEPISEGKPGLIGFVDSIPASKAIITSDVDGYFNQLSIVDMAIQMKKSDVQKDKTKILAQYKTFLATEVSNWTHEEKVHMLDVFARAKEICDKVSPRIFPGDIKLIKIKTNHYGRDVYYTRGKHILIPENIFESFELEKQLPVMLHEIFHVFSRYNEPVRNDLYAMIGFKKSDKKIVLADALKKILLTNPDGVSLDYIIKLDDQKDTISAIPVITSKFNEYKSTNPFFLDYLNFDLYGLSNKGDHYVAEANDAGKTLVNLKKTPSFFTKIKDNTQYIIHPDEIMADNFMLALLAKENDDFKKFSPSGRKLIDQVLERLSSF